jgi:hypothetical protein
MNRRQLLASLAGLIAALPFAGNAQAEPDDDMIGLVYPGPGEWTETPQYDTLIEHAHERVYWGPGTTVYMDEETAAAWDELRAPYR